MQRGGGENALAMLVEHIQGIFSKEHGGPTYSLSNSARGQAARGIAIRVRVLEGFRGTSAAHRLGSGVDQAIFPVRFPKVSGRSPKLSKFLRRETAPDIYHLHGAWLLAMKYGADEARKRRIPYMIEMMGAYQPAELKRKPFRKRVFRGWFQDAILQAASCIQTNSIMEARQLAELGFRGPFAPIPVGFDLQAAGEAERKLPEHRPDFAEMPAGGRIVLFLARVHANKGIEVLLEAWQRLAPEFENVCLVVAGSCQKEYGDSLLARFEALVRSRRVKFLGHVSDLDKVWLYRKAAVYCLPSFSENYGATIQDALGYGVPVITTRETPWDNLEKMNIGWLVEPKIDAVAETLRAALLLPSGTLAAMGERAGAWIRKEFSLETVIGQQLAVYDWMLGGDEPDFLIRN